jgi:LacI family transcriptional regulator
MATITDVSKRAGVSRSTVSRVVADNGYVSEAKRRAIEAAIAELGYRPNTLARGLRSNRSNIIGGVVVNVSSPFYAQMVGGTQTVCRAAGKSLLVTSGHAEIEAESRAILELLDRSCDGLILYLENPMRADVLGILGKSGVPVVTIGGHDCAVAKARVLIDNFSGAREAMRHLLELGHRRIAHLSGGLIYHDSHERLRGIEAALGEYGMDLDDITIEYGEFEESFGFAATERLLQLDHGITAIFAGDDDIAAGALLAIKRSGRHVPDDLSLIGFDDNFHARHLTPALTTVRQPVSEAGKLAASLMLQMLAGEPLAETEIVVPTHLVLRESTAEIANTMSKERA